MPKAVVAGVLLLAAAPAAAARVADYNLTEQQFADLAASLHATGFKPMPQRGGVDVVLEESGPIDHKLAILGISCRAWTVENPISQMIRRALTAWDRDGDLAKPAAPAALVRLKLDSASTAMRCVQVAEFKTRCLLTTSLAGTASREKDGATHSEPVAIEVEQEQHMAGLCNGLAQGSSLMGRAASIALVERLAALAAKD